MTNKRTRLAPLFSALSLAAAPIIAGPTPPTRAELHQNVEYARPGGAPLALDAFVPAGAGPFPAVIIVHGGGFVGGDRAVAVAPLREALSNSRFVWFSIDYRLAPAYKPSDAANDVDTAVSFVRRHAREFKVDASRLALLGESAGGYQVLMAASRLGAAQIQAVAAVGAPAEMWKLAPAIVAHVEKVFGIQGEAALRAVSPVAQVRTNMPPVLLLHGSADGHVPVAQAEAFCQAMKQRQQRCDVHVIQGGGHSASDWVALPAYGGFPMTLAQWLTDRLSQR